MVVVAPVWQPLHEGGGEAAASRPDGGSAGASRRGGEEEGGGSRVRRRRRRQQVACLPDPEACRGHGGRGAVVGAGPRSREEAERAEGRGKRSREHGAAAGHGCHVDVGSVTHPI